MNQDAKRSRVIPKRHATDQLEATQEKPLRSLAEGSSIDRDILALVKGINAGEVGQSFEDGLAHHVDAIGYDLRLAHHLLATADRKGLDTLAQRLSQNALKVGAAKILSTAIEVQGLARIGDFSAVSEALGRMEVEYHHVRRQLS